MTDGAKSSLNWGMLVHLAGLTTYVGIPFGNIIAPLVIWLVKKDSDSFVNAQGREALNFNISVTIYGIIAGLMCYILIGFVLLPILLLAHIILVIMAALKANKGESYRYPFTLRFIN